MIIFPSSPLSCCLPRRTPMALERKGEIQLLQEKASLDMAPNFLWHPATKSNWSTKRYHRQHSS
jgi:hypothetical protein